MRSSFGVSKKRPYCQYWLRMFIATVMNMKRPRAELRGKIRPRSEPSSITGTRGVAIAGSWTTGFSIMPASRGTVLKVGAGWCTGSSEELCEPALLPVRLTHPVPGLFSLTLPLPPLRLSPFSISLLFCYTCPFCCPLCPPS